MIKTRQRLGYCGKCKENSTVVKIRVDRRGIKTRCIICLNHGHGLVSSEILEKRGGESDGRGEKGQKAGK